MKFCSQLLVLGFDSEVSLPPFFGVEGGGGGAYVSNINLMVHYSDVINDLQVFLLLFHGRCW